MSSSKNAKNPLDILEKGSIVIGIDCERGTVATAPLLHGGITTGSSPVVRTNLTDRSRLMAHQGRCLGP